MANQTAYLDGMLRWGLDWLIKVLSTPTCFLVRVFSLASRLTRTTIPYSYKLLIVSLEIFVICTLAHPLVLQPKKTIITGETTKVYQDPDHHSKSTQPSIYFLSLTTSHVSDAPTVQVPTLQPVLQQHFPPAPPFTPTIRSKRPIHHQPPSPMPHTHLSFSPMQIRCTPSRKTQQAER